MALLNAKLKTPSKVGGFNHQTLSEQALNKLSTFSKKLNHPSVHYQAIFRQRLIQLTKNGELSLNDYTLLKETAIRVFSEKPNSEDAKLAEHVLNMLHELKADEDIFFILPSLKTNEYKYPRTQIQFIFLPIECA